MPTAVPAAAFWAIRLAVVSASGGVLKATGSGLSSMARREGLGGGASSDEVAVTVRVIEVSVSKSSVPVPERVMTPVLASMAKRESSML